MTLNAAIAILCEVHLKNIEDDMWCIEMGAAPSWSSPWISNDAYVEAWKTLRDHLLETRK